MCFEKYANDKDAGLELEPPCHPTLCGQKRQGHMLVISALQAVNISMFSRYCHCDDVIYYMGISKNSGTHKSSILIGFSIINHPFWGTPIFGNIHIHPGSQADHSNNSCMEFLIANH